MFFALIQGFVILVILETEMYFLKTLINNNINNSNIIIIMITVFWLSFNSSSN